ncbi:MAG: prepilin-type N-terminal cleavage/methylation domain-containing protein [Candidatus Dojkabacteria bacterium]|jgi:prepilin-type N-terminal cleavage/methylation domain-containing protein
MDNGDRKVEGFTLIEILLTLGILLIIATLVFPITLQRAQRSKLESYANQLTIDLYYQQQRSSLKEIPSGINIDSNGYTLFDGESFSTASETQVKTYPANISINSVSLTLGSEILFPAGKFKPSIYGTLVITDGQYSALIYINREGLIGYEIL